MPRPRPTQVRAECLDILAEMVRRFGAVGSGSSTSAAAADTVLSRLADSSPLVVKRATATLCALAPALSDATLESVVDALLGSLERAAHGGADASGTAAQTSPPTGKATRGGKRGRELSEPSAAAVAMATTPAGRQPAAAMERSVAALASVDARVLTQALGGVSRAAGARLSRFVGRVLPLLLGTIGSASAERDAGTDVAPADVNEVS